MGLIAATATKLIWRRELATCSWLRLAAWASASMAAVSMIGLFIFERDGKMITYAGMLVACAVALWAAGFRRIGR
ncbi:MAG: hypothetical protein ABI330_00205 [Caldimonas sp.]|nr:hypothetical protein [Pseudomonadota bacterium]